MEVSKNQVRFECEFLNDPPRWLQIECPICLHILREPHQVTCCGKSFCRQCIEMIIDSNKPCLCYKQDNFNDFPNKGLQQPLYGFKVYCSNKEIGCEWKGELGKLDIHLNQNFQSDDAQFEGCEFAEIECSYCSDIIVRNRLLHHENELCDKRPFSCKYCSSYESTYEEVIHNHWPVCGHHPVQCPNECGAFPLRLKLENHVAKDCPLTLVKCEFHYAGCMVKLPRRNMPDHLKESGSLVTHLSLLAVSHKQQQEEMRLLSKRYQEEIKVLKKRHQDEIKTLTEHVGKLTIKTNQICSHVQIVPIEFSIENPRNNNWSSTPFYSHSQGYKLRLRFNYKDKCSSITCHLMQGEFDSWLKWPLKTMMTIVLHQSLQGEGDYELSMALDHKIRIADISGLDYCGSMTLNIDLNQYIHNNCLKFRIVGVQLL